MNARTVSALALALATVFAAPAHAGDSKGSAARVGTSSVEEAIRTGDVMSNEHSGMRLYELFPHQYPARIQEAGKTRQQVQAETAEAVRTGNLMSNVDSGRLLSEIEPARYPAHAAVSAKTRAQVRAEAAEAIRTGDVMSGDFSGVKLNELHATRVIRGKAL